jgi:hypothetical protein
MFAKFPSNKMDIQHLYTLDEDSLHNVIIADDHSSWSHMMTTSMHLNVLMLRMCKGCDICIGCLRLYLERLCSGNCVNIIRKMVSNGRDVVKMAIEVDKSTSMLNFCKDADIAMIILDIAPDQRFIMDSLTKYSPFKNACINGRTGCLRVILDYTCEGEEGHITLSICYRTHAGL